MNQRMKRWAVGLLVPLLVAAVWLVMRGRGAPTAPRVAGSPVAVDGSAAASLAGHPQGDAAHAPRPGTAPTPERVAAPANTAARGASSSALSRGSPSHPPGGPAPGPGPAGPATPGRAAPPPPDDEATGGKLVDRTGWDDQSVGKQLNKEFMPLASECIAQAQARKPALRGRLGFSMVLAPTENGRAIVASLRPRNDNEIDDPELLECIRESSFALEGLQAPHDFDITMPIGLDTR